MHAGLMIEVPGGAPPVPPGDLDIWVAETSGPGLRVLDWQPDAGDWTVVVMRADGGAGIDAEARMGATVPGLPWLAAGLLAVGAVLGMTGAVLIVLAAHRANRPAAGPAGPGVPAPRGPVPDRALTPQDPV
jgi:hypothetical protein